MGARLESDPVPDGRVIFDDLSSPWHTVCEIDAPDTPGLLAALTTVFAAAGIEIKAASVGRSDGRAVDRFELTGRHGPRLVPTNGTGSSPTSQGA